MNFFFQTWFPDEAYFHGGGIVIEQNMHYWEMEPPAKSHKRSSHCLGCHVQARSNQANVFLMKQ